MSSADTIEANEESISRIVGGLMSTRSQLGGWDVHTPMLYPSGAGVTVSVTGPHDSFKVSDIGLGFTEAFSIDVANSFSRAAKELSEEFGVTYDKRRLFIPGVSWGKLGSAVKMVANCSQAAVMLAAERANERRAEERADRLYAKLLRMFPNTAKHAQLPGASSTEWTVDALVRFSDHDAAFDAVTSHANSVASTSTKFGDIGLRENAPTRCAAVESKRAMGTLLAVLSQAANVIEDGAPDQQFQQFARAA